MKLDYIGLLILQSPRFLAPTIVIGKSNFYGICRCLVWGVFVLIVRNAMSVFYVMKFGSDMCLILRCCSWTNFVNPHRRKVIWMQGDPLRDQRSSTSISVSLILEYVQLRFWNWGNSNVRIFNYLRCAYVWILNFLKTHIKPMNEDKNKLKTVYMIQTIVNSTKCYTN